jgi:DNA gyrase/topoisomerase IV subunit A
VTELPVGYGVDKFKAILVDLMDKNLVKDFDNNSTEEGFDFTITIPREVGKKSHADLMKMLKLIVRMTENITLWTTEGQLKRYNNVYDALLDFVEYRIDRYEDRRKKHIELFSDDQSFLEDKLKFILIWNDLENPGKMKTSLIENTMVKEGVREESLPKLMSMRISSLTLEQVEELKQKIKDIKQKITVLEKTQAGDMYSEDLKLV